MNDTALDIYDAVLLDLDGTVYHGGELITRAKESIYAIHDRGSTVRYVTNNASKSAWDVAERLNRLGLPARADEVATSAEAGAAVLAQKLPTGAKVLVVGSAALAAELEHTGLIPVWTFADDPVAVVQGHSPETAWPQLAEACLALRTGAVWVTCNDDLTLPAERGELPGNGAMVAALRAATGRQPEVAGKPQRPLLDRAVNSARANAPIMVGDRMSTDIAGAVGSGMPSLLVLTGVDGPAELLAAPPGLRPDYVGRDLAALSVAREDIEIREQEGWKVAERGGRIGTRGDIERLRGTADRAARSVRRMVAAGQRLGRGPCCGLAVRGRAVRSRPTHKRTTAAYPMIDAARCVNAPAPQKTSCLDGRACVQFPHCTRFLQTFLKIRSGMFLELLGAAFALSLDNFRTSIAIGTSRPRWTRAAQIAAVFGFWDGIAPLGGIFLGSYFRSSVGPMAEYIGAAVVVAYGAYLVTHALRTPPPEELDNPWMTLLGLPISLSLDNILGGTTLGLAGFSPWISAIVCACATAIMSLAGLALGYFAARLIRIRIDLLTGAALILMGGVLVLS